MGEYDFRQIISSITHQYGNKIEDMEKTRAIIDHTFFSNTR